MPTDFIKDALVRALQGSSHTPTSITLVASTGGHLSELRRLIQRYQLDGPRRWLTFDSEQSRSLLEGELVTYLTYIPPRDIVGTLQAIWPIIRTLRQDRSALVISTGAAIAISAFIAARLQRVPALYVESAARVLAPSSTGRIVSMFRLARPLSQTTRWRHWERIESIFGDFRKVARSERSTESGALKVFVSLGTIRPYRFDRAVDAVLRELPPGASVTWQLGSTSRSDLAHAMTTVNHRALQSHMKAADVVVTHCGVGSVLEALEIGKIPIVLPRSSALGEHVDEHQAQLASYLRGADVAIVRRPDDLKRSDFTTASTLEAVNREGIR